MGTGQGAVVGPLAAREAATRIVSAVEPLGAGRVALDDALGQVLAEPIVSPIDIPAWTNSAMDGYAARGDDVRGASLEHARVLTVVEQVPAGSFPARALGPGECARIFTGAPLPEGADTVIRQEDTDGGAERVVITRDRDVGLNIRRAGEDIRRGATVLEPGAPLGAAQLGVLASLAVATPLVHRRPLVSILGGGDEIVDIDQPEEILSGRKVASSNTHTLMALVRLAGGVPRNLGIARDTPESLRAHLEQATGSDLLVTTAGISVGEHDHLRRVIEAMGGRLDFWKLRMRPGAPVGFGFLSVRPSDPPAIPWIGLPGNPVSTMVTFELFVRPAIRRLLGHPLPFRAATGVEIEEPIRLGPRLQHFLRAVASHRPAGRPSVRLTGSQGSGILTSMVKANALLMVPEGTQECEQGARMDALLPEDWRHQETPPF